jgi:uncharacterized protein YcbX
MDAPAHVAALRRHPVKGFSAEPLPFADLTPGEGFPCDRIYAVENGPSGFDPAAPAFVPKQKFTVLAALPQVARLSTVYADETHTLRVAEAGATVFEGRLDADADCARLTDWLTGFLGEDARGELKVVHAPGHRFTDHPLGQVSIINLASVRDLESRLGREIDPLRFRGNIYVEGWPAWAENDWIGRELMVGFARVKVFKPIVRCVATHVNLETGKRDIDMVKGLFDAYGHTLCGVYVHVADAGRVTLGDACTTPQPGALAG